MRRAPLLLVLALASAVACTDATVDRPAPPPNVEPPSVEETPDGASEGGAVVDVAEAGPPGDGGCPAPAKLSPADVPVGFLKPVKVTISFLADGDSGRFNFPTALDQGVRMLFIDTEESGGTEGTQFGVQTKTTVHDWIRNAAEIQIAVREDYKGSNTPDIDPYGRWLSMIFLDGELLQTRIIRQGLSVYYTQFACAGAPFHEVFLHAEAEANANDRGIWDLALTTTIKRRSRSGEATNPAGQTRSSSRTASS